MLINAASGQTVLVFTTESGTTPSGIDLDVQVPIAEFANLFDCSLTKAGAGVMKLQPPPPQYRNTLHRPDDRERGHTGGKRLARRNQCGDGGDQRHAGGQLVELTARQRFKAAAH